MSAGSSEERPGTPLRQDDPEDIGPYRLLRRLGAGGMGTVYLASAPDGRPVAVKVVHEHLAERSDFRLRFAREIANTKLLRSPHTLTLVEADHTSPRPYLVTEYVAGPTLAQEIERLERLPAPRLKRLAVDLLRGIIEFHRLGIAHRDIKPSNIILSAHGACIIDLGLARSLRDPLDLTRGEGQPGTPQLMAPEQWDGTEPRLATDVFAWGVVVAFAGTGRWPFSGTNEHELRHAIMSAPPELRGLDPHLRAPVARSLDKAAEKRPDPAELLRGITRTRTATYAAWAALGSAGSLVVAVTQGVLLGWHEALPYGTPALVSPALAILAVGALLAVYCRLAPPERSAPGPPEPAARWEAHLRAPALLQPLLCAAVTGAVAAAGFGWGYGAIVGLVLGAGADRRVCARGLWPITLGPVPPERGRKVVAFGLAAGAGLLVTVVSGHLIAGAMVAVGAGGVAAWQTILAPSIAVPDARPALHRDALLSSVGAALLAVVSGNAAGTVLFVAATFMGGFEGFSIRNLPGSGEMFDQFSEMAREAWFAVGVETGIWYLLTSATARFLVARGWLLLFSDEHRPAPAVVPSLPFRGAVGAVMALSMMAPYLVHSLPPVDACDGYLGRRQRVGELQRDFREGMPVQIVSPGGSASFRLRWSSDPACAWALITSPQVRTRVWLERITREGSALLGSRDVLDGSHTGAYAFNKGRIRACGRMSGRTECTAWVP
ncbi:serine/threonine-protein kinase [Planomonospora sp. ID82291]|uniref:serine/threonine protein kinase n=1 Tax=Planomonospora sp. ID82291 TaxID=2738136 RepID=UPI0018C38594|nr:serine/threonine-protein kinase [Planomonospora sp. ID82291]MBG0814895.1 serine/threonine protein kinase [Planomonospora sp. ID82291]